MLIMCGNFHMEWPTSLHDFNLQCNQFDTIFQSCLRFPRTTRILPCLEKELECMTLTGGFSTCSDGSVERDNILAVENIGYS